MICKHWRPEDSFCIQKQQTVNPDELCDCAETCSDYEPRQKHEIVTCSSCGAKFPLKKTNRIRVKNAGYPKCPKCGAVVGIERDDEKLSK